MMGPMLVASGVGVVVGGRPVLSGIDLEVHAGELLALVGPNGAGKSTLLAVLAGDRRPDVGSVRLDGIELAAYGVGPLARRRSVLLQQNDVSFPFRVLDVVAMGRAPWRRRPESELDEEMVAAAMSDAEVEPFASRSVTELSGGERARVAFARNRAQAGEVVLLDEPTASLDIRHQERVLEVTRAHADAGGSAVVVLHDLDLAAAYADRVAVLDDGRIADVGAPELVLQPELLSRVYRFPVDVERTASGTLVVLPRRAAPSHRKVS